MKVLFLVCIISLLGLTHSILHLLQSCQMPKVNVLYLLDGSKSINNADPRNFDRMKKFMADLTSELRPGSRVSVVLFASQAYIEFNFEQYPQLSDATNAIRGIRYLNTDRTDTVGAMETGLWLLRYYSSILARQKHTLVIVVTDGMASTWGEKAKKLTYGLNWRATVFAVGVGSHINKAQLLDISGNNKNRVLHLKDYSAMNQHFLRKFFAGLCQQARINHCDDHSHVTKCLRTGLKCNDATKGCICPNHRVWDKKTKRCKECRDRIPEKSGGHGLAQGKGFGEKTGCQKLVMGREDEDNPDIAHVRVRYRAARAKIHYGCKRGLSCCLTNEAWSNETIKPVAGTRQKVSSRWECLSELPPPEH